MSSNLDFYIPTPEQVENEWSRSIYDSFELTESIRLHRDSPVIPSQGFRRTIYSDPHRPIKSYVLMASVTAERLFETFISLLDLMEGEISVVLDSSCRSGPLKLWRDDIDINVLKSNLYDYVDLLLNDGCTGISVVNFSEQEEIQFDEHKMLVVYTKTKTSRRRFEEILIREDVYPNENIKFVTECEHMHSTESKYEDSFNQLLHILGAE